MTKAEAFANLKKHPVGTSIICLSEDQSQSFLSVVYIVAKGKCNVIKLERYAIGSKSNFVQDGLRAFCDCM